MLPIPLTNPATSTNTDAASDPTPPPGRLLELIGAHAGPDGWWEFSYGVLADGAPGDPRLLEAGLADLERQGLIEIDRCRVRLAPRPPG